MEKVRSRVGLHGPVGRGPPFVARRILLTDCAHRVILHGGIFHRAVVDALQVEVEPADHVRVAIESSVVGEDEVADLVIFRSAVKPRADEQLLFAARIDIAFVLPTNVAVDRADVHEIEPAPEREARHIHFVEVLAAILCGPILVVVRMLEPFFEQLAIVFGHAAHFAHRLESFGPRGAADAVAFVVEAEAGVGHVLGLEGRRPRNGEEVLGEPGLRPTERADLARAPRLLREPFHGVESILQFAPAESAVADPGTFGFGRPAEVLGRDHVAALGQFRVGLARAGRGDVRVSLFVQHGPRPFARWREQVDGEPRAVAHRHHLVLLDDLCFGCKAI